MADVEACRRNASVLAPGPSTLHSSSALRFCPPDAEVVLVVAAAGPAAQAPGHMCPATAAAATDGAAAAAAAVGGAAAAVAESIHSQVLGWREEGEVLAGCCQNVRACTP